MKSLFKKILAIFFFMIALIQVHAQKAIVPVGGNATGTGGTVSYTVGQIDYNSASGTNGKSNQGVQQPHEILIVGIDQYSGSDIQLSVYPNPTLSNVTLSVKNLKIANLHYQIFDANGTLLSNEKLKEENTRISLNDMSAGTYILKITENESEVRAFKIIKK